MSVFISSTSFTENSLFWFYLKINSDERFFFLSKLDEQPPLCFFIVHHLPIWTMKFWEDFKKTWINFRSKGWTCDADNTGLTVCCCCFFFKLVWISCFGPSFISDIHVLFFCFFFWTKGCFSTCFKHSLVWCCPGTVPFFYFLVPCTFLMLAAWVFVPECFSFLYMVVATSKPPSTCWKLKRRTTEVNVLGLLFTCRL